MNQSALRSDVTIPGAEELPATGLAAGIVAACDGDAAALDRIADELRPRLLKEIRTVLGPDDPDEEDVVEEIFAAMLGGKVELAASSKTVPRLLRVARNLAGQHSRARLGRWGGEED